ncbi:MAG TPA: divergent polysaccharide deacetylase family protein [bacterium]|nr:divergent polysaccharide deacetylase family protein [bacterium]
MKRKQRSSQPEKKADDRSKIWIIALTILAGLLLLVNLVVLPPRGRDHGEVKKIAESSDPLLESLTTETLANYHISANWIQRRQQELQVQIPPKFKFHQFYLDLQNRLKGQNAAILSCQENIPSSGILLTIGKNDQQALHLRLIRNAQLSNIAGYAAIIIDDFGYSHNDLVRSFISFPHAITLSIIPGLRESRTIARDAELAKKTYLVHMPMEPLNEPFDDLGFTILAGQDAGLIRMRTRSAFSQLPHAVGLNNHQGSRATADEAVMRILLQELKSLDKFFIDSHTHPSSIGLQIGKQVGLPVEENQLFLDAKDDKAFIRSQMERLATLASTQGKVIAIGHVRPNTLQILQEMIPQLEDRGIKFVPVSQLVR